MIFFTSTLKNDKKNIYIFLNKKIKNTIYTTFLKHILYFWMKSHLILKRAKSRDFSNGHLMLFVFYLLIEIEFKKYNKTK